MAYCNRKASLNLHEETHRLRRWVSLLVAREAWIICCEVYLGSERIQRMHHRVKENTKS
jgi:hypothetical protein